MKDGGFTLFVPKGFVIDLDGTLYRGKDSIPGSAAFMEWLRLTHYPYLLATNCPSRTPEQIVKKLLGFQIRTNTEHIITSGILAAHYLCQKGYRRVFLLASKLFVRRWTQRDLPLPMKIQSVYWSPGTETSVTKRLTLHFGICTPVFLCSAPTPTARFHMKTLSSLIQHPFAPQSNPLLAAQPTISESPASKWLNWRSLSWALPPASFVSSATTQIPTSPLPTVTVCKAYCFHLNVTLYLPAVFQLNPVGLCALLLS